MLGKLCTMIGMVVLLAAGGCAPAMVGGAATGAYKVGTDERTMGTMWDDAAITAKVKKALVDAYDIKARRVDVDTLDGVVTMTGVVETEAGYRRAEELAGEVEGVRKVTNLLQVGTKSFGQALDDKVLGTKIKAKLISEPEIKSLNIDVDVDRAVATLTGTVENREQRTRVLDIARSVSGVAKVIDNMKVVNP